VTSIIHALALPLLWLAACLLGIRIGVRTEKGRNKAGRFRP
jgi:hypothetical protein